MLVTVSSKVSAALSSSTTRGLAGCNVDLQDAVDRTAPCSHTSRLSEKTQEPQSWPAPVERQTAASEPGTVADRLGDGPVGDDAAVAHDHGGLPRRGRGKAGLNYVRHT